MGLTAALSIAIGVYPSILYDILPFTVEYKPYTVAKVVETMQLLALTGFGFWLLIPRLAGKDTMTLDTDWFYRRLPRLACNLAIDLQIVAGFQRAHESVITLPRTLCDHLAYRWRQSRGTLQQILSPQRGCIAARIALSFPRWRKFERLYRPAIGNGTNRGIYHRIAIGFIDATIPKDAASAIIS